MSLEYSHEWHENCLSDQINTMYSSNGKHEDEDNYINTVAEYKVEIGRNRAKY